MPRLIDRRFHWSVSAREKRAGKTPACLRIDRPQDLGQQSARIELKIREAGLFERTWQQRCKPFGGDL